MADSQARILAKDFAAFVKRPTRRRPHRAGVKKTAAAILVLLALNALFTLLVCLPVMLALNLAIGLDLSPRLQTGGFMFAAVAIAPVVEELMFRAGLRSARWAVFGMPLIGASLLLSWGVTLCLAVVMGILWLMDYLRERRLPAEALARLRWKRGRAFIANYARVVHVSAFLFAAAHCANFVLEGGAGWKSGLLILAVMSQLMNGLAYSYLRLRYGLSSSMAAHFSWNAVTVGLALLGL